MELRHYVLIVRRWLWLLVLATALAGGIAYLVSHRQTKQYRATATLIINQSQAAGTSYDNVLASQQLAKSYASVATLQPVLAAAAKSLGLPPSAVSPTCACLVSGRETLRVSADVPVNTQLVTISATSSSPQRAADGANAVANAFAQAIQQSQLGESQAQVDSLNSQLQTVQSSIQKTTDAIQSLTDSSGSSGSGSSAQLAALQSQLNQEESTYATLTGQLAQIKLEQSGASNSVRVAGPAVPPSSPFSPRTMLNVGIAAVLGLLLAAGLIVLFEYLDDRVQSPDDVEAAAGAATLGVIERLDPARHGSGIEPSLLLSADGGFSSTHEAYRLLRSNLEFAVADRSVKTLVVTSAHASEGKSTTAANLAIVLAQTGRRVLLVDADLRRPSLHKLFQLPNEAGFSLLFLLTEATELDPLINDTQYENLQVMTCGLLPPNPTELLSSSRMRQLVQLLSEKADVVIFDSSPVLAVADAAEVAARVDGVLLVVDSSKTRPSELAHAQGALARASAALLGVVLNKLPRKRTPNGYQYCAYHDYRPIPPDGVSAERRALSERRLAPVADRSPWTEVAPPGRGVSTNGHNGNGNGHHGASKEF